MKHKRIEKEEGQISQIVFDNTNGVILHGLITPDAGGTIFWHRNRLRVRRRLAIGARVEYCRVPADHRNYREQADDIVVIG